MFFALPVRALLRQTSSGTYRLNLRSASYFGKSLETDDNPGQIRREHNPHAPLPDSLSSSEINTKVHQPRGSNADTFGDLSSIPDVPTDFVEGDEADKVEGTTYSREREQEIRRVHYSKLITELLAEKKLSMALQVLESEMKGAKVKPDRKLLADLVTFCGKVGYPQKAFSLFNQMKKRGYAMTGGIYTSLFNSCANCPIQDIGLKYAQRIKKTMDVKGWIPNTITYNAMIKAFGRSGDLETAFFLADEMMRNKVLLEPKTISFLLQACISNKENGFLKAVQVWHKMRQYRLRPEVFSYNLLLRSVRDTGMGDLESINAAFKILMPGEEPLKITAKDEEVTETAKVQDNHKDNEDEVYPWDLAEPNVVHGLATSLPSNDQETNRNISNTFRDVAVNVPSARPNLIAPHPTLNGLTIVNEIKTAADRLLLLGGVRGVLESMLADGLEPDVKTFTLLLHCIPSTVSAEEALIKEMKIHKVDPDTGFFNALIHRRGRRHYFQDGFNVLDMMKASDVEIDNITVHSLAFCITDVESFQKFLDDIKEAGYSPTSPMLGSVLKNAMSQTHFKFIDTVMNAYQKYDLPVHKATSEQLEDFYRRNLRLLKGKDNPPRHQEKFYSGEYFRNGMKNFIIKISDWKRRVKIDETSDADYHDQFKKTGKEAKDLEPYIQKWKKGDLHSEWQRRPSKSPTWRATMSANTTRRAKYSIKGH